MSEDNKVVPFPSHKVKRPQLVDLGNIDESRGEGPGPRNKILIISLSATVLLATFLTTRVVKISEPRSDRELANDSSVQRSLEEDMALAKKIALDSLRGPASGASNGRRPTAEEGLRHGELAGLYSMQFDEKTRMLSKIEFAENPGTVPRYLTDREGFLIRYRELFVNAYDGVEKGESYRDDNFKYEVYNLRNSGQTVARAHFKLNNTDQLFSMKVESLLKPE